MKSGAVECGTNRGQSSCLREEWLWNGEVGDTSPCPVSMMRSLNFRGPFFFVCFLSLLSTASNTPHFYT